MSLCSPVQPGSLFSGHRCSGQLGEDSFILQGLTRILKSKNPRYFRNEGSWE